MTRFRPSMRWIYIYGNEISDLIIYRFIQSHQVRIIRGKLRPKQLNIFCIRLLTRWETKSEEEAEDTERLKRKSSTWQQSRDVTLSTILISISRNGASMMNKLGKLQMTSISILREWGLIRKARMTFSMIPTTRKTIYLIKAQKVCLFVSEAERESFYLLIY